MASASESASDLAARLRAAGCVFAEDEARVLLSAASAPATLEAMARRREAGEPLEQIVGSSTFCGIRVAVDPGVFVPRRRTELLARQAAALVGTQSVVVDLCCGSGAVGAAIAALAGPVELHAVDVDPAAVRCARRNLAGSARVHRGDLFTALPKRLQGRIDVVAANVPYVPADALALMPAEARLYEPRVALDGGQDGLDMLRRVVDLAPYWLAPGGRLLSEVSERQAPAAVAACAGAGLSARVVSDTRLDATVVIAGLQHRKEPARREHRTAGKVLSDLARQALTGPRPEVVNQRPERFGFRPLPRRGPAVSNALIDRLLEDEPE